MTRRQIDPLRTLTDAEREGLTQISRSTSEPASHVAHAKALLAVAEGKDYTEAAHLAGRRAGDAVAHLVSRFNRESLGAIGLRHGGGPARRYGPEQQQRILQEIQRTPDREQDGTATWPRSTLQKALRQAPDGLPQISTYTIGLVLHEAGFGWQESRTWCETGKVKRKRKSGVVEVATRTPSPKKVD